MIYYLRVWLVTIEKIFKMNRKKMNKNKKNLNHEEWGFFIKINKEKICIIILERIFLINGNVFKER